MKQLWWVVVAAVLAYACSLAAHHPTPVDRALPLMALCVTVVAWATYPAVMVAVPILIAVEIAVADEGLRLLLFGAVLAAAFAVAIRRAPFVVTVAAIVLLRWIPFDQVPVGRELVLILVALAIVLVLGHTPFAVAVAVIAALVTPAVPLRTLAVPVLVLLVAMLARWFGMPDLRLTAPSIAAIGFVMLFFAWSGIVARACPYFLIKVRAEGERRWIGAALAPRESIELQVPKGAAHLIVSGANVPQYRRGALLGTIDGRPVRIGDAADWGYMRRDHFFGARNPLPRDPAGKIRDYGYAAWVDGAGRVPLPRGAKTIRVTAAPSLPPGALLQVESFELSPQ